MPLGEGTADDGVREREGAVLSAAASVVTTSAWARRVLLQLYSLPGDRVHVAEPGVDAAELAPGTATAGALLSVAAVIPGKGHDVLLDALATLTGLRWQCLCVGSLERDPAFVERLRRRVAAGGMDGRVRFSGPQAGAELAGSYSAADVLVLPSRAETYGMVVTEALARGLPVVAADVGGVPEALGHGADGVRPGLLVPPDDAAALARRAASLARGRRPAPAVAARGARAARVARRLVDDHLRRGRRPRGGGAMTVEAIRVSPAWLDLRERADAAARSRELVWHLRRRLPAGGPLSIHDLGCGSGAMGRWLAPLLPGPQHWVLHDRDPDLLALAEADQPGPAADGAAVTVETRLSDVTRLGRDELAGATLITASALLDLLTADELVGAGPRVRRSRVPGAAHALRHRSRPAGSRRIRSTRAWRPRSMRTSAARHRAGACSARMPSRPPQTGSAGWGPRSSSGRARGASAPPTPAWPSSGSPVGSAPRASRSPRWPPTPISIDAGV